MERMEENTHKDIDSYIKSCPENVRPVLEKIRSIIHHAAPDAEETISYGMPTFKLHGEPLVYFAAWKEHIGFYATPEGNTAFKDELAKYHHDKGSVRFPLDQPIPFDLIEKIAAYRYGELKG